MRLLLLNNEYPPIGGGGATVTAFLAREFVRQGHEVRVLTAGFQKLPAYEQVDGFEVFRIRTWRMRADWCSGPELIAFALNAWPFARRMVKEWQPDLVQAYFAVPSGVVAYALNVEFGVPYGVYMGGSDVPGANPGRWARLYPFLSPVIRRVWRRSSLNAIASQGLLEIAQQADPTVSFAHLPNGVDIERFQPVVRPANEAVEILSVGRLIPRKGFQYLIRALPLVRARAEAPFRLAIIGSGSYGRELENLARQLSVADLVQFRGAVTYDELLSAYQQADLFSLTSTAEGMACVMLEAMACGLPLVSSIVPGNDELVTDGVNGFLLEPTDTGRLADVLVALINDAALRARMSHSAVELIQPFSWTKIAAGYDAHYRAMVGLAPAAAPSLAATPDMHS